MNTYIIHIETAERWTIDGVPIAKESMEDVWLMIEDQHLPFDISVRIKPEVHHTYTIQTDGRFEKVSDATSIHSRLYIFHPPVDAPKLMGVDNRPRFTYASRYRMEKWTPEERKEAIAFLQSLDPQQDGWISVIMEELKRAETKHPNWPENIIEATAIVCEESGELIRAALQQKYEGGNMDDVRTEAIQTAAMCIRLLKHLPQPPKQEKV